MSAIETALEVAKVVVPAVTGVGGAIATLWKTTREIFQRLDSLEREAAQCKERMRNQAARISLLESKLDTAEKRVITLEAVIDELMSSLSKTDTDFAALRASLQSYVQHSGYAKSLERLAATERRLTELDEALVRNNTTLLNFAKEQNEQWQGIHRSLGQLEGWIKGRESIHDG